MTAGEAIDLVEFVVVPTILVCSIVGYGAYLAIKKIRGSKMKPRTRKEYEEQDRTKRSQQRQAVSDMVGDGLLNLYSAGKIDSEAYRRYSLDFGVRYNLPDLLPGKAKLTVPELKSALKKRRNGGSYFGIYEPVKLPGERKVNELEALLLKM